MLYETTFTYQFHSSIWLALAQWKMLPTFPLQNGGTPLLYAVHGNHVKCVKMLLGKQMTEPSLGACEHLTFSFPVRGAYLVFGCITCWCLPLGFHCHRTARREAAPSHSSPTLEAFALPAHIWGHTLSSVHSVFMYKCCPVVWVSGTLETFGYPVYPPMNPG